MPASNKKVDQGATVRVDKLFHALAEHAFKRGVEPALNNVPLWDYGLGDVVKTAINESGIPLGEVPVVSIARKLGLLGPGGGR
jgi:hypothetical protein